MKKTYQSIEFSVVTIASSDVIMTSIEVRSTGISGSNALAPDREMDYYDNY